MANNAPQIQARFEMLSQDQQNAILFLLSQFERANHVENPLPRKAILKDIFLTEPFSLFKKFRPQDRRVAIAFIELWNTEKCAKPDVDTLAQKTFVTPNHLRYLCKKSVNKKFREIGQLFALEKAKKDLMHTEQKIIIIARKYGFINESHFGRIFKSLVGVSPGEYRERHNHCL